MIILLFIAVVGFLIYFSFKDSNSSNTYTATTVSTPESKQKQPTTPKYTQEEYKTQRISYYKQSKQMPRIINFLTQHGTPNKVIIKLDSIESYYTDGVDRFVFLAHGISDLHCNDTLDREANTSEPYYLACAINESFNFGFTVREINKFMRFERNDGSVAFPLLFQHVELTRPSQSF